MKYLGYRATDTITGFSGTITGFAAYLTGCNQYLMHTKADKAGKFESNWFDEQRLKIDMKSKPVVINNGSNPGADLPAPRY
jgi:hypothetical protein